MAVSGLPETCHDNARHICEMALEMMKMSKLMEIEGEPIEVNVLRSSECLGKRCWSSFLHIWSRALMFPSIPEVIPRHFFE